MKKSVKKNEKKPSIFRFRNVSIFFRDGKFYWMIKSCGFDSIEDAFEDAQMYVSKKRMQIKERLNEEDEAFSMLNKSLERFSGITKSAHLLDKSLERFSDIAKDNPVANWKGEDNDERPAGEVDKPVV